MAMLTYSPSLPKVDFPTLFLALGIYVAFGLLTWFHHVLPWWLVAPLGGYVIALHGSLQHEAVHGFPFRNRVLTEAVVFPSLWLWMPFEYYRESHLAHHRDEQLTCPLTDPESNYIAPSTWTAMGPFHRTIRRVLTTLAGRLVIGPPYAVWTVIRRLCCALRDGNMTHLREWLWHVPGIAVVLIWVMGVFHIPLWQYALFYVYPGISLTLLRSYAEHQAALPVGERIATVKTNLVMGLLYAFNNLHALHHAEPATPWYRRPARYRLRRAELDAASGHYIIHGYSELFRRYLFWSKESPVHPFAGRGFPV
jgi:fatty acid desaturase